MCVGGSKRLADALVRCITKSGGEIRLNAELRRILVESGRVIGVELSDGQLLHSKFVASSLNPQQTFLDLIDSELLPPEWKEKARNYRYNLLAPLFALNLNLSEPPAYLAAERHPELKEAFMVILGLDDPSQFKQMVEHHEVGTIPPPIGWGSCPTSFDQSQAPPGTHTAFLWEKVPFRLMGNAESWQAEKDKHATELFRFWMRFAPNLECAVLDRFAMTPFDIAQTLPNMRDGDLLVGALSHGQVGYNRPFEGAGEYRGYFGGLYLCGSSSHPGGNITGLPGYNCARTILSDIGS
jgi:phytoene dehydrogenase-like protein